MALSQPGANYRNQSELQRRDRIAGEAIDDVASQIAAIREQGNFGQNGKPAAPHPITAIGVSASAGFGSVILTHTNAPAGVHYILEYSTTPNFKNPIRRDLGQTQADGTIVNFHSFLQGLTLFFRAAPQFPASPLAPWVYLGNENNPTPMTF